MGCRATIRPLVADWPGRDGQHSRINISLQGESRHYCRPLKDLPFIQKRNPPRAAAGFAYFCHVRFLWRFDFKRLRRLCLFIFSRRFFLRFPMGVVR
jgi:hypothetical protein